MKPKNVEQRKDLTSYAYALFQDLAQLRALVNLFAPIVPTGAASGQFNKFDNTAAFKAYGNARRAIGGQANEIGFLSDAADYSLKPYGLKISIDEHERSMAGEAVGLLEEAKTRTLTINCLLSHLDSVIDTIKESVSAHSTAGKWGNPNVDPIHEINQMVLRIWKKSGMVPNNLTFDFGAWAVFAGHKAILSRMPGADIAQVSPDRVARMLINPNMKVTIVEASILTGGGLGNASATKTGLLGGSVFAFFNSVAPTPYDPSFAKTFAMTANLFTEVYSYPEAPHLDWYENDWTCQPQIISNLLVDRVDVEGAA